MPDVLHRVPSQGWAGVQEPGSGVPPQHPGGCCRPVGQSAPANISSSGCNGSGGTAFTTATAVAVPVLARSQSDWPSHGNLLHEAQQLPQLPSTINSTGLADLSHAQQQLPDCHDYAMVPVARTLAAQHTLQQGADLGRGIAAEAEPDTDRQDSLAALLRQSSLGQLFRQELLTAMGSGDSAPPSPATGSAAPHPSAAMGTKGLISLPTGDRATSTEGGALSNAPSGGCAGRAPSQPPLLQPGGSSASLSSWHSIDWDAVVLEALEGTDLMEDFLQPAPSA
jgi:hypothetical protein